MQRKSDINEYLLKLYTDPNKNASFGGINRLYEYIKQDGIYKICWRHTGVSKIGWVVLMRIHCKSKNKQTNKKDIEEMTKGKKRPERAIPWALENLSYTQKIKHEYKNKTNKHKTKDMPKINKINHNC